MCCNTFFGRFVLGLQLGTRSPRNFPNLPLPLHLLLASFFCCVVLIELLLLFCSLLAIAAGPIFSPLSVTPSASSILNVSVRLVSYILRPLVFRFAILLKSATPPLLFSQTKSSVQFSKVFFLLGVPI